MNEAALRNIIREEIDGFRVNLATKVDIDSRIANLEKTVGSMLANAIETLVTKIDRLGEILDQMEDKDREMLKKYGYGAFCAWEKNHVGAVREAMYSIADAVEQHSEENYREVFLSTIMFKDELIRRALIHDADKFANLDMFSGYVNSSKKWEELGGPHLKYGAKAWKFHNERANRGLNTSRRHAHSNDHHREFFVEETDMTMFPLIEMVCDWYGVSARYNEGNPDMAKFKESYDTNQCNFPNSYQRFVIDKVYGFLAKQEYEIINRISEVCKCYDKDESDLPASSPELSHLDCDIKQFLTVRKQLYDCTLEASTMLAARHQSK